jgi:hypothetical protein
MSRGARCTIYAGSLKLMRNISIRHLDTDFDNTPKMLASPRPASSLVREPRRFSQGLENQPGSVRQVCPRPPPTELSRIRGIPAVSAEDQKASS